MTNILLLGATGRTGTALLNHRPPGTRMHAAARVRHGEQTPGLEQADDVRDIDLDDRSRMRGALTGIDVVVNAIRLREAIPARALADLHDLLVDTQDQSRNPVIVHVGGAGSLHTADGRRFWQDPAFPPATLPRGTAHAALRDHLESSANPQRWAYLIPPPDYRPEDTPTGTYRTYPPARDERHFLDSAISYEDFALALADAISGRWTGTHLISGP